ncbi:hypothetical protein BHM03_00023978 [Ensete ventricosum]|nr:hypothetical protein BHM03_00023978 [Ensete ventricosum]
MIVIERKKAKPPRILRRIWGFVRPECLHNGRGEGRRGRGDGREGSNWREKEMGLGFGGGKFGGMEDGALARGRYIYRCGHEPHRTLDGAQNDRARLEGDVLSLTEATALLEVELKAESQNAVAAYKASRRFESSLEKMGNVSYEFRYRVTLERLQGKYPGIMIELDPFAGCPKDANVEMDLDQPFNDGTPSEKQPTL